MKREEEAFHRTLSYYLALPGEEVSRLYDRCRYGALTEDEEVEFRTWIWCQAYWYALHYKRQDDEAACGYADETMERLGKRWIEEKNLPKVDNDSPSQTFDE